MEWSMVVFFACNPPSFCWRQRRAVRSDPVSLFGVERSQVSLWLTQLHPLEVPALRRALRMACMVFSVLYSSSSFHYWWPTAVPSSCPAPQYPVRSGPPQVRWLLKQLRRSHAPILQASFFLYSRCCWCPSIYICKSHSKHTGLFMFMCKSTSCLSQAEFPNLEHPDLLYPQVQF